MTHGAEEIRTPADVQASITVGTTARLQQKQEAENQKQDKQKQRETDAPRMAKQVAATATSETNIGKDLRVDMPQDETLAHLVQEQAGRLFRESGWIPVFTGGYKSVNGEWVPLTVKLRKQIATWREPFWAKGLAAIVFGAAGVSLILPIRTPAAPIAVFVQATLLFGTLVTASCVGWLVTALLMRRSPLRGLPKQVWNYADYWLLPTHRWLETDDRYARFQMYDSGHGVWCASLDVDAWMDVEAAVADENAVIAGSGEPEGGK